MTMGPISWSLKAQLDILLVLSSNIKSLTTMPKTPVCGVAQWLERRSLTGELSLIYA